MTYKSEQTEEYINYITSNAVPKEMTLQEIAQESYTDKELQQLRAAIRTGTWESISKDYRLIKDELTIGFEKLFQDNFSNDLLILLMKVTKDY